MTLADPDDPRRTGEPVHGTFRTAPARLAAAGDLTAARLAEMSAAVLRRTGRKPVRARLVLLGADPRRLPDAAAELLPGGAEAFGHEGTAVRERALKLVARHTAPRRGRGGRAEEPRWELAGFADRLSPVRAALLPESAKAGGPAGEALHPARPTVSEPVTPRAGRRPSTPCSCSRLVVSSDAGRLGHDVAELVALGTVEPNRLADSARSASATGAYATTWSVLGGGIARPAGRR